MRKPTTVYRGHRDGQGIALIEVIEDPNDGIGQPIVHHVRHSPTGFEWGYGGSGPADTARCILIDYLGHDVAPIVYQRFKALVVQDLEATWELSAQRINDALEAIRVTTEIRCLRCGDVGFWMNKRDALDVPEDRYCTCEEGQRLRHEFEQEMP
jgi:Family of unknown function (DUF6166)